MNDLRIRREKEMAERARAGVVVSRNGNPVISPPLVTFDPHTGATFDFIPPHGWTRRTPGTDR